MRHSLTKAIAAALLGVAAIALPAPALADLPTGAPTISDAPANGQWAANTTWYYIMHQPAQKNYLSTSRHTSFNLTLNGTTPDLTENGMWCIVGNEEDGYSLYNLAAGPNYVLGITGSGAAARTSIYDTYSIPENLTTKFDLTTSGKGDSTDKNWFAIKKHGTTNDYFNKQGGYLATWNDGGATNDNGSAFTFIAADDIELTDAQQTSGITEIRAIAEKKLNNNFPYLKLSDDDHAALQAAYDASQDDKATYLKNLIKATSSAHYQPIPDGTYILLGNRQYNLKYAYANGSQVKTKNGYDKSSIWEVKQHNGRYRFYNVLNDKYFGAFPTANQTTVALVSEDEAYDFEIFRAAADNYLTIQEKGFYNSNDKNALHMDDSQRLVRWTTTENASHMNFASLPEDMSVVTSSLYDIDGTTLIAEDFKTFVLDNNNTSPEIDYLTKMESSTSTHTNYKVKDGDRVRLARASDNATKAMYIYDHEHSWAGLSTKGTTGEVRIPATLWYKIPVGTDGGFYLYSSDAKKFIGPIGTDDNTALDAITYGYTPTTYYTGPQEGDNADLDWVGTNANKEGSNFWKRNGNTGYIRADVWNGASSMWKIVPDDCVDNFVTNWAGRPAMKEAITMAEAKLSELTADKQTELQTQIDAAKAYDLLNGENSAEVTAALRAWFVADVTVHIPGYDTDETIDLTVANVEIGSTFTADMITGFNEFFTITGLEGEDFTVTADNCSFNATGEWTLPIEFNKVYRVKTRGGVTPTNYNFLYSNTGINTRNNTNADAFEAERLWFFTKVAGTKYPTVNLRTPAAGNDNGFTLTDANAASFTASPTPFIITTNSSDNGSGFSLRSSNPANINVHLNDVNGALQYWNDANSKNDVGSRFNVFNIEDSEIDAVTEITVTPATEQPDRVGGTAYNYTVTDEAKAAAKEGHLADAVAAVVAAAPVFDRVADVNKLFRISFNRRWNGHETMAFAGYTDADGSFMDFDTDGSEAPRAVKMQPKSAASANQLFTLERESEGSEYFYLKNVNHNDLYLGEAKSSGTYMTAIKDYAGLYTFKANKAYPALWVAGLHGTSDFLNASDQNDNILRWNGSFTDAGNRLIIEQVETIDLEVAAEQYTSICYPFAVVLPEGLTAYIATEGQTDDNGTHYLRIQDLNSRTVEANEAVLIAGPAGTYRLTIKYGEDSTEPTEPAARAPRAAANILTGITAERHGVAEGSHFVLTGTEMVKNTAEQTTLPANSAVLATASLTKEAHKNATSLSLTKTDIVTSITDITADGNHTEAQWYTLQGVRVAAPAAGGIYIRRTATGSQKVLVK